MFISTSATCVTGLMLIQSEIQHATGGAAIPLLHGSLCASLLP
jgi:hypothetical protein